MSALFVADSAEAKSTAIDDLGRPHPHFIVGREGGAKFDRSRRAFQLKHGNGAGLACETSNGVQRVKEVDHDELGFCGSVVPHPPRYSSIPFNPGSTLFLRRPS